MVAVDKATRCAFIFGIPTFHFSMAATIFSASRSLQLNKGWNFTWQRLPAPPESPSFPKWPFAFPKAWDVFGADLLIPKGHPPNSTIYISHMPWVMRQEYENAFSLPSLPSTLASAPAFWVTCHHSAPFKCRESIASSNQLGAHRGKLCRCPSSFLLKPGFSATAHSKNAWFGCFSHWSRSLK